LGLKKTLLLIPIVIAIALAFSYQDIIAPTVFARPNGSTANTFPTTVGCTSGQYHLCVDEIVPSDSDFIRSAEIAPGGSSLQGLTLTDIGNQPQLPPHVVSVRLKEIGGGANPNIIVWGLRENGNDVAVRTISPVPTIFTTFTFTLDSVERGRIISYNNLVLFVDVRCPAGCSTGASNTEGAEVSWAEFRVEVPPMPPVLTSAVAITPFAVDLTWTEPPDISDITQYTVFRDGSQVGTVPVGQTTFRDTGLSPNTPYIYFVIARGVSGQSLPSNSLSVITPPAGGSTANPPRIFLINSNGIDTLRIAWDEPPDTSIITTYRIERRDITDPIMRMVGTVPVGTTTFSNSGLQQSITYTYRVISIDTGGLFSIPSNAISGVASIDETILINTGQVLEPNPTNNFIKVNREHFSQNVEMLDVPPPIINQIINDMDVNRLNAYQIIQKMKNAVYGNFDELRNAGNLYGQNYIDTNDLTRFIDELEDKTRSASGGSNGEGDNPDHAVEEPGESG